MKKLFFTALVAIVAVGGAYAQQQYASTPFGAPAKTCNGTIQPLCGPNTYFPGTNTQAPLADQNKTARPI